MKTKHLLITLLVLVFFVALMHLLPESTIPSSFLTLSRWVTLAFVAWYAYKRHNLSAAIFFFLILGVELGNDARENQAYIEQGLGISFKSVLYSFKISSDIFLRMIKTIIAPLLFATLVYGIAGHSNLKEVGRMGLKSIIYFEVVTTIALFIGLAAINLSGAGFGVQLQAQDAQIERANKLLSQKQEHDVILDIFPENIAKSIVENQVLQVVVFSILFGIAVSLIKKEDKKKPILNFTSSLSEVMFKFTDIVMYAAPLAVGGAMAYSVASMGLGVLKNLLLLVLTLYVALIVFVLFVIVPIGLIVKIPFKKFIAAITEPVSLAFATASSEAALPLAMENLEKMGIPRRIVAFVLPTGYSFNLDGTTLYLSLASVFVAQASGIDLTLGQQIGTCLILMLTSKGVAGVRGASFLILVSTVSSLGLDPQKAFAILAVDALMDMARTSVNVIGNCMATYVVAKWEGEV
jgi:proton glutamate symport protein